MVAPNVRRSADPWFDELYAPRLRSLLRSLARERQRVDDVLQETFISAYSIRRTIDRSRDAWPLLARIATRRLADDARKEWQRSDLVLGSASTDFLDRADPALDPLDAVTERDASRSALQVLNSGDREALVLRDVEELGYDEAAAVTGRAAKTLRNAVSRARAEFRSAYTRSLPVGVVVGLRGAGVEGPPRYEPAAAPGNVFRSAWWGRRSTSPPWRSR